MRTDGKSQASCTVQTPLVRSIIVHSVKQALFCYIVRLQRYLQSRHVPPLHPIAILAIGEYLKWCTCKDNLQ